MRTTAEVACCKYTMVYLLMYMIIELQEAAPPAGGGVLPPQIRKEHIYVNRHLWPDDADQL